jgi:uncharacterized membrane protein YcaP (DUF421 family)
MDPLRIAVRAVFAYVVLAALVRLSGKRTVKHASPFDFTVALIIGDMVDDVLWAEVNASSFVVAAAVLFMLHTTFDYFRFRLESRR